MPNIKSQIKRDATNKSGNATNSAAKSEAKTAVKKVETLAAEGKKDEATAALTHAISLLDKLAHKGILSVNGVNHKKAHLEKVVSAIK